MDNLLKRNKVVSSFIFLLVFILLILNIILSLQKHEIYKNIFAFKDFTRNTSNGSKKIFLNKTNESLNHWYIFGRTKDQLLLRKASVLAIQRGRDNPQEVLEASNIFVYFIQKFRNSNKTQDIQVRDYSIVSLVQLQNQCCNSLDFITNDIIEFKNKNKYIDKKYSIETVKRLILIDLMQTASAEVQNKDAVYLTGLLHITRMFVSDILKNTTELDSEDQKRVISLFLDNIDKLKNVEPLTYSDEINAKLEPIYEYACSYNIYIAYITHLNPTPEDRAKVYSTYTNAFNVINASKLKEAAFVHYYLLLTYFVHISKNADIERHYEFLNSQAKIFESNLKSNNDLRNVVFSFLTENLSSETAPEHTRVMQFITFINNFPDLANYLHSNIKTQ